MNKKGTILLSTFILITVAIVLLIIFYGSPKTQKSTVGIILTGSMDENGWNGKNYAGCQKACEELGLKLLVKENVMENTGECEKAVKELVKAGASVVIFTSYYYTEEMKDKVSDYPDIVFYQNSSEFHAKNLTSYFARLYQARYLAGVAAGLKTKTNKIGYVAAMSNNEVNRGISAFTLGLKSVNPEANVYVTWTNSWDDEEKERENTNKLIAEGVDIVTYHQNTANVVRAADENGIASIGYNITAEEAGEKCFGIVVCNWDKVYYKLLSEFKQGRANNEKNKWIGIDDGAVSFNVISGEITKEDKEKLNAAMAMIINGGDVFSGVIYDNAGNLKCDKGEMISDEELLENFGWLVDGVIELE